MTALPGLPYFPVLVRPNPWFAPTKLHVSINPTEQLAVDAHLLSYCSILQPHHPTATFLTIMAGMDKAKHMDTEPTPQASGHCGVTNIGATEWRGLLTSDKHPHSARLVCPLADDLL